MTSDEKQKILIALMQINVNNGGNRMTSELANGTSMSMAEFLDTLLAADHQVVKPSATVENLKDRMKPTKE